MRLLGIIKKIDGKPRTWTNANQPAEAPATEAAPAADPAPAPQVPAEPEPQPEEGKTSDLPF